MRCLLLTLMLTGLLASPSWGAAPLRVGFFDDIYTDSESRGAWLDKTVAERGSIVRVTAGWGRIAPTRPANPRDPADPAYDWQSTDSAVREADRRGLNVLLNPHAGNPWTQNSRPATAADAPSWDPDPQAYRDFAEALARRYSGSTAGLPRVRSFQAWNEPNLSSNLTPQWRNGKPYSPALYRRLLNGLYEGVKSVHSDNLVVTAGTGPFGDPQRGGRRIMPVRFWRELLRAPTRFDAWSHHPYGVGGPRRAALNEDDVTVPDLHKIRAVVRSAVQKRRVSRKAANEIWVTEISWDSSPPDPRGVPAQRQARWLEESFYLLWRQGVSTITWFRIVDSPPEPSYAETNQSGIFLLDGRPKPAATAFRFPFVSERANGDSVRLWSKAPSPGTLVIERKTTAGWRKLASYAIPANRIVFRRLRLRGRHTLRARIGSELSLPWNQRG